MPPVSPTSSHPLSRTFLVAALLLGLIGVIETAGIARHYLSQPRQVNGQPAATPAAAVKTAEEQLVAAAAEKSLVAAIGTPTPAPTATPAPTPARPTPQSQVAEWIAQARTLRDAGDTGTAMACLRQAQSVYSNYAPIVSEMAITYEKMGLNDKAIEQWRRIYQMGERAGIYYAAAEAKLRSLQLPDSPPEEAARPASLAPSGDQQPVLSLGKVATTDDTGTTQPARCLKLNVPISATRPGSRVEPREVVIQVFFYEALRDGSIVETNGNVTTAWSRRTNKEGEVQPVDWSTPEPETLEVTYAQLEPDPKDPRTRERRNYFGYSVRVYYKGVLNAKFADPQKLLGQFIPPAVLPSSNDLPQ